MGTARTPVVGMEPVASPISAPALPTTRATTAPSVRSSLKHPALPGRALDDCPSVLLNHTLSVLDVEGGFRVFVAQALTTAWFQCGIRFGLILPHPTPSTFVSHIRDLLWPHIHSAPPINPTRPHSFSPSPLGNGVRLLPPPHFLTHVLARSASHVLLLSHPTRFARRIVPLRHRVRDHAAG